MFNKDVVAPGKMRRRIVNPRIILLDSPLEYKKGENIAHVEIVKEEDWYFIFNLFNVCYCLVLPEHVGRVDRARQNVN